MSDESVSDPSRRFPAESVLAEVNESTASGLRFVGMAEAGASGGAAYVEWPDGRAGVLTQPYASVERMRLTAEILEFARSRGLPVPRHDLVVELADGSAAVVQERLPGAPTGRVDIGVIEALIAMNERFAGLLVERPDVPIPPLNLRPTTPPNAGQEILRQHSDRTRRILARIHEIGADEPSEMSGDDLLHIDYARSNVLWESPYRITGVIDWNLGIARGDRRFALVGLRRDLEWSRLYPPELRPVDDAALDHLDDTLGNTIDPATLHRYWAHWTLSTLHGVIPMKSPDWTELFLSLGESRLGLS
jgi:aminoglycoside phosphotransferase (APT) family kinase protein